MANSSNPSQNKKPNAQEQKLIEGFRRHPELGERMQAILELADSGEGTADEVEALLVEEIRRLGKSTMESWAGEAEQKSARDFKQQNPGSGYGKKND